MKLRAAFAAALIASVGVAGLAPALARDLAETHVEVHQPGGKTPARLYRQITRDRCTEAPHRNQAGKLPRAHVAAPAACDAEVVLRDPRAAAAAN